jgi:hypothetical protein
MIWPCGQKFRPKARCPPSHERSETRDSRQAEFDLQGQSLTTAAKHM